MQPQTSGLGEAVPISVVPFDWNGDDVLIVALIIAVPLLHWIGRIVARRQRRTQIQASVNSLLDWLSQRLAGEGASRIDAFWKSPSGEMVVEVVFPGVGTLQYHGYAGEAWHEVIETILDGLASITHPPDLDEALDEEAAPAPIPVQGWWDVLGVKRDAPYSDVRSAYRVLAKEKHPDHGGSDEAMAVLNSAMDAAKSEISGRMG